MSTEPTSPSLCWTIVGGGQMGRALVSGMLQAGVVSADQLRLVEPSEPSRQWWQTHQPQVQIAELADALDQSDAVLVAVKPNVVAKVAQQATKAWQGKLIVSIAAGVSLEKLGHWFGHQRVVRVMPNTPSLVGRGASAFCCDEQVSEQDQSLVESMLAAVGATFAVTQSQMDAVTGLSGSGPAYVCLIIEALADGGVAAGLPRALAMDLATETVLGTAEMIKRTGQHPAVLKDAVTSPGGTTIAGLAALEQNGVRAGFIAAVVAAAKRSIELGD